MNPISDAIDALTVDLQSLAGSIVVTRDPSAIGPQVSKAGLAVLVSPASAEERSSYRTWFLTVPVSVAFPIAGEPRHVDAAYTLAHEFMNSDVAEVLSMDSRAVQLDSAMVLPAITVTFRISTDC